MSDAPAARIAWLDGARGIGILLVVYAHVLRSLVASGVVDAASPLMVGDRLIYCFHMPLFFLLSGLVARPVPLREGGAFVTARAQALLYPYLLWSLVQGGLAMLSPGAANHPVTAHDLVAILWSPIAQFWFLYVLFLCQLTLLIPGRRLWPVSALVLAGVLLMFDVPLPVRWACQNLFYFAPAVLLTARRLGGWLDRPTIRFAILGIGVLVFTALYLAPSPPDPWASPVACVRAWAGIAVAIAVARMLAPRAAAAALVAIGQASMAIYLVHVIAAAVVRALLARLAPGLPALTWLLLLTGAGIAIPYAMARAAQAAGIERWLGFARTARGQPRLAAAAGL